MDQSITHITARDHFSSPSIELFQALGVKMTPELKAPSVEMPFNGMTQDDYAQKMIDEYKAADVPSSASGKRRG
ncbi:hypothetical protein [Halomonas sp. ML-15]|uniref:hypothetical protein n=1 Tax=Halomonas sp. ML-15 TaxID=2773305 RepID=UPI00398E4D6D